MFYSVDISSFPLGNEIINTYRDQNDLEWKIATVDDGIYIGYFGDEHFKDTYLEVKFLNTNAILTNTGCFFIGKKDLKDDDQMFEVFVENRDMIKENYTDDIWEMISQEVSDRISKTGIILDCELIKI